MKKQKSLGNKGFSLVELIVVIAIMAVLVGVLAPQFIQYVARSRVSTDIQNLDEIRTAIEVYAADNDISNDSITITTTTYTISQTDDADLYNALANANLDTTKITMKSSAWFEGTSDNTITIAWTSAGGVTITGTATVNNTTYNASGN